MTFTDQWANRHDGLCQDPLTCSCYVRWLEGRLGEMPTRAQIKLALEQSLSARPTSFYMQGDEGMFKQIAVAAILALLPPKGAGE